MKRFGTDIVLATVMFAGASVTLSPGLPAQGGVLPVDPQFHVLKPSTTGVPGEEVRVMTFDPQGNLWIVGRWPFWGESALAMLPASELPVTQLPGGGFDTGKWIVWSSVNNPIPSPYIYDLEFGSDGVIWIASDGGLTRFDRNAAPGQQWFTYNVSNSPLIMTPVRSIDFDSQGNLWLTNMSVQSSNGALFKFNPKGNQWTKFQVGNQLPWSPPWYNVFAVMVGSNDHVWLSHFVLGGLAEFDGTSWVLHDNPAQMDGMIEDMQGNIWSKTGSSGLWKWNGSNFTNFNLGSQGTITALGMDHQTGMVYAGAWYGDIYKMINGTTPSFFVNAADIPGSIHVLPSGEVWINNYGGNGVPGTVRQYSANGALLRRMNTYNSGLPDYFIDRIQKDLSGNVWFACGEGGLSRMEGSGGSVPTRWRNWGNHNDESEPYPWVGNEPMDSMYDDGNGIIWMGGNGVGKWNQKTGTFEQFWNWQNSSLGVSPHIGFARDGNEDMWVATDMYGIFRLNPQTNNWEQKLFGSPGSTSNYIGGMTRDTDGNLWISTPTSLHFFNGSNWFAVGPFHGSPAEWPTDIIADPHGGVWIGADNGLIHYRNGEWTLYDMSNSPMPANHVVDIDVRPDGLVGFSVMDFQSTTPFPSGVVLFDGENWQVFSYGTSPLPHYQLAGVGFDGDGDIWVSTVSEGVTEIVLPTPQPLPGDITGDGVVNVSDLLTVINAWGVCPVSPQSCSADVAPPPNGDGVVNVSDLLLIINNWG